MFKALAKYKLTGGERSVSSKTSSGLYLVFVTIVKYQSRSDLSLRRPIKLSRVVAAGCETPGVVGESFRFKRMVSD